MKEKPLFRQVSRGYLVSLLGWAALTACAILAVSVTRQNFRDSFSCGGGYGVWYPVSFLCDYGSGGSPIDGWEGNGTGDGGLLSGLPCSSPCVFGVRAGETPLEQVIPVLEKYGISQCVTEENISWLLISCRENRLSVQVDTHTNLVNAIWFYPSIAISLGEIIEKYGEPDYVTVDLGGVPGTIQPRFYWNSIRMGIRLPEIPGETYQVEKTTQVEGIGFSNEDLYRTTEKQSDPYYKPWNGYGRYQPETFHPGKPRATSTPRE